MSAPTSTVEMAGKPPPNPGASFARQVLALVRRNLLHIRRQPEMLADVTIQPIMFVLLFAFVFGGSISTNGSADYEEWLIPGIMAQTMAFSSLVVALGLCNDLQKGIIDRFRSLPIARGSVLTARSISSLLHSSIGTVVMALTGLTIGWRINASFLDAVSGFALLLFYGFAMIWVGTMIGAGMRSMEAVNGVMFTLVFPLTFLANTFVPTENMPYALRIVAEWNPISSVVQAVRELWGNDGGAAVPADAAWPMHDPILASVLFSSLIIVIFAPIAIGIYRKRTTD